MINETLDLRSYDCEYIVYYCYRAECKCISMCFEIQCDHSEAFDVKNLNNAIGSSYLLLY